MSCWPIRFRATYPARRSPSPAESPSCRSVSSHLLIGNSKIPFSLEPWQPGAGSGGGRRLGVDTLSKRDRIELRVRSLLLVEVGGQETDHFVMTELFGPGNQRAVAADLVVFDSLRARDDRRIEHSLVSYLAGYFFGFLDQTINGRALGTARLLLELQKHLVQPLDLLIGLLEMRLQTGREIAVGRLIDHLRQRLRDLLLCIINILQAVQEQAVHCLDVLRE